MPRDVSLNLADTILLRFTMVGAGNTLVGLAVIYAAKLMDIGDSAANAIGYTVGFGLSFYLNKQWTFSYDGSFTKAFVRYFAVVLLAYAANFITVWSAINVFGVNSYLSQALGVPAFTIVNYLGSRLYAFVKQN